MNTNTNNHVSITETNQIFLSAEEIQIASDEDVLSISGRLLEKNRDAYEALTK